MASIYLPYLNHSSFSNQIFMRFRDAANQKDGRLFETGIYPIIEEESSISYAKLGELLLSYDKCFINISDYLYLGSQIGFDIVHELINQDSLALVDTTKINVGVCDGQINEELFLNYFIDEELDLDKYLSSYYSKNPQLNSNQKREIESYSSSSLKTDSIKSKLEFLNKEIEYDLKNPRIMDSLGLVKSDDICKIPNYNHYCMNRVMYLNSFMYLRELVGSNDILLPQQISELLDLKVGAYVNAKTDSVKTSFTRLCSINNIPDINKAILIDAISYKDIINLRNKPQAIEFRKWLTDLSATQNTDNLNNEELASLYRETCFHKTSLKKMFDSKSYGFMNFAVPAAISQIPTYGNPASLCIGALGLLPQLFYSGKAPNTYINNNLKKYIDKRMYVEKMTSENNEIVRTFGELIRKEKCPCGSNKKYKHCHGKYGK